MRKDRYKGMGEFQIDFESRQNLGDAVLQILDQSPGYPRNRAPRAEEEQEMAFARELLSRLTREDFNVNLIDGLLESRRWRFACLPLTMRKTNLQRLLRGRMEGIHTAPFEAGEIGPDLFRQACLLGLEGIVSKQTDRFL